MASNLPDAFFFDFDGVLIESTAVKEAAFRALYEPYGDAVLARVLAYHGANEGISRLIKIRHCHRAFLGVDLDDEALAVIAARYRDLVETRVAAAPWVPGAKEFLERHAGLRPCFVVSGTPEDELRRIATARDMDRYFVEVRGSPATKADIVADISARHGIDPARSLFVGDAMADRAAAIAHGMRFIGRVAADGHNPFPPGTVIVADMRGLPALLV